MIQKFLNYITKVANDNMDDIVVALIIAAVISGVVFFRKQIFSLFGINPDGPNAEDKLMDRNEALAKELGATKAQLQSHLDTLKAHNIPPDQLEARLRDMLEREQEMLERLDATPAVNEETDALRQEAEEAIRAGEPEKAAHLLHQAETRDTQAAAGLDDEADDRRQAASGSAFAQGELALNNLDYADAARHFKRTAGLLPEADAVARGEALNLAGRTYLNLAEYAKAEAALIESQNLFGGALAPDDPKLAPVLNNLAQFYQATDRYAEAEPLMDRVLKINEQAYDPDHPFVAIALNNLARLYMETNRPAKAEPLYGRAIKINETAYGPDDPNVAITLNNLARLYHDTDRLAEAEPLMERALKISEQAYGSDHPDVAIRLNNLARLYQDTRRLVESEPLFVKALGIFEESLGPEHPRTLVLKNNLAILRAEMGDGD